MRAMMIKAAAASNMMIEGICYDIVGSKTLYPLLRNSRNEQLILLFLLSSLMKNVHAITGRSNWNYVSTVGKEGMLTLIK